MGGWAPREVTFQFRKSKKVLLLTDKHALKHEINKLNIVCKITIILFFFFLCTGGTSTGTPVCLSSVLQKKLEIGFVII
jgi:hypothetical protein